MEGFRQQGESLQSQVLQEVTEGGGTLIKETEGIKVYKYADAEGNLARFRAMTTMRINMDAVRPHVVTDTTERFNQVFSKIDPQFKHGKVLERIPPDYQPPAVPFTGIKYAAFRTPPVISDRDFVFLEHSDLIHDRDGNRCALSLARSVDYPDCPEVKGYVRGSILLSGFLFREIDRYPTDGGAPLVEAHFYACVDPKGWIPAWVTNMGAVEQALNLKRIQKWLHTIPHSQDPLPRPTSDDMENSDLLDILTGAFFHCKRLEPTVRAALKASDRLIFGRVVVRKRIFPPNEGEISRTSVREALPPASLAPQDNTPIVIVLPCPLLIELLDTMVNINSYDGKLDRVDWAQLAMALGMHPRQLSQLLFSNPVGDLHNEYEILLCIFENSSNNVVRATWKNIIDVASNVFPSAAEAFKRAQSHIQELAYETLLAQQRAVSAKAVNVDSETMEDGTDFQNVAGRLYNPSDVRVFLKRSFSLDSNFQGNGWLKDALGGRVGEEWCLRNYCTVMCNSRSLARYKNQKAAFEKEEQTYTYCKSLDITYWLQNKVMPKCGSDVTVSRQPQMDEVTVTREYYNSPRSFVRWLWWKVKSWKTVIAPKYRHAVMGTLFSIVSAGAIGGIVVVGKRGIDLVRTPKT